MTLGLGSGSPFPTRICGTPIAPGRARPDRERLSCGAAPSSIEPSVERDAIESGRFNVTPTVASLLEGSVQFAAPTGHFQVRLDLRQVTPPFARRAL